MALTVKPEFLTEDGYGYARKSSTIKRSYHVEGPELNVANGVSVAVHATGSGVPALGSTYGVGGRTLTATDKDGNRLGPTHVLVTVEYTWGLSKIRTEGESEAESERRELYKRPFNERLENAARETQDWFDWLAEGDKKLQYVVGEPPTILVPQLVWSFTVHMRPIAALWSSIGKYNTLLYPPGVISAGRPFQFAAGTLQYMGPSGGPSKAENVAGTTWAWEFTLSWMFRPEGWKYHSSTLTHKVPGESTDIAALFYWNPFTAGEVAYSGPLEAHAPLYRKDNGGKLPIFGPYEAREGADFATDFALDWTA